MKQAALSLSALSVLALGNALCGVARADLTWEHKLSVRMGASQYAKPIASVGLQTQWQSGADADTAARHRLLVRASSKDFQNLPELPFGALSGTPFDLSGGLSPFAPGLSQDFAAKMAAGAGSALLSGLLPQPPLFDLILRNAAGKAQAQAAQARKAAGPVELVQVTDFADDKFLSYVSAQRTYLGGPLRPTLQRVRFEPVEEARAAPVRRAAGNAFGQAARAPGRRSARRVPPVLEGRAQGVLPPAAQTRTINGMEARGFRFVALANSGAGFAGYGKKSQEWAQIKAEMWVAPEQEGDAVIRSFNRQASDLKRAIGGQTASMWANETGPVVWQMMPQEVLQVFETLVPPQGRANEFFGGTPLLVHLTLTPPPVQRLAVGEMRVDLTMVSRSTEAIPTEAFTAPANYKPEALEPLLKRYEKALDEYYKVFETNKPK
jgi:hypothetical protein